MAFYIFLLTFAGAVGLAFYRSETAKIIPWLIAVSFIAAAAGLGIYSLIIPQTNTFPPALNVSQTLGLSVQDISLAFNYNFTAKYLTALLTVTSFFVILLSLSYAKYKNNLSSLLSKTLFLVSFLIALVCSGNLLTIFPAFAFISIFSFCAVNFYQKKQSAVTASFTGLSMNFLADAFILFAAIASFFPVNGSWGGVIAGLIFIAILIKGGQIGFGFWTMETTVAPSTISALLGALIIPIGSFVLFYQTRSLLNTYNLLPILAIIASVTAISAAFVAGLQFEIKRILSYSSVSQTGLILLAATLTDSLTVPLALLTLHAVAKIILFLSYAAVIQATSGERDIRSIGGVGRVLKVSAVNTAVSSLILILNPLFAASAFNSATYRIVGMVVFVLTLVYLLRPLLKVFFGKLTGEDAVVARITSEPYFAKIFAICFNIFAIWLSVIFASAFKPMPYEYTIAFITLAIFSAAFIITCFIKKFSFTVWAEERLRKPYAFLKEGGSIGVFYTSVLPAKIKRLGYIMVGFSSKSNALISNTTAGIISYLAEYADLKESKDYKLYLYIIFAGILLFLGFSLGIIKGV